VFVLPCDSPFVSEAFLRGMVSLMNDHDEVIVPRDGELYEPIHALYSRSLIPLMERIIDSGERKITLLYEEARVKEVGPELIREWDPERMTFFNVNTPEDLARAEEFLKDRRTCQPLS